MDLDRLLRDELPDPAKSDLSNHVGECVGCQKQMEELATGGDLGLSNVVRHIDQTKPPSDSAYWQALNKAEADVTMSFGDLEEEANNHLIVLRRRT